MTDIERYAIYGLIGAAVAYALYKGTEVVKAVINPPEVEEEKEYILVKFTIPKVVGEGGLKRIVDMIKPSRTIPSYTPLGVYLEWDPISVDTPLGPVSFAPPRKFVSVKNIWEARRKIQELEPTIEDKNLYWLVTLKVRV